MKQLYKAFYNLILPQVWYIIQACGAPVSADISTGGDFTKLEKIANFNYMEIIPAIDIIKGKCVRLVKGKFESKRIYSSDPFKIARSFQKAGLKRLHLIDLEGAKEGKIKNWQTIKKIAQNTKLLIEFGGGIREEKNIQKLLKLGVDKIILGSLVLKEPEKFKKIFKKFEEKIIVGVDVKKYKICYHGWQKESKKEIYLFSKNLVKLGIKTVICTDIERDGTLKGPNFSLYKKLVKDFPKLKIIASGGVRSKKDLEKLSQIGVFGAITGKAIYENKISLGDLKSMIPKRIIPCLDIKNGKIIKGVKFVNLRFAGDPIKLAKKYSDEGTDELAMLDISASQEERGPFFDLVKKVAKVIKVPLIAGGGIKNLGDIQKYLDAGADKVAVNTSFVKNPEFINKAVKKFGSERIIANMDAKRTGKSWKVYILGATKETRWDVINWAREVEERGVGEILCTSIDKDGTKEGYDIKLLKRLKENVSIPIIASGGAGKKEHFLEAFAKGKADAALAAGIFHFGKIKISKLKKYLKQKGINVC